MQGGWQKRCGRGRGVQWRIDCAFLAAWGNRALSGLGLKGRPMTRRCTPGYRIRPPSGSAGDCPPSAPCPTTSRHGPRISTEGAKFGSPGFQPWVLERRHNRRPERASFPRHDRQLLGHALVNYHDQAAPFRCLDFHARRMICPGATARDNAHMTRRFQFSLMGLLWWMLDIALLCGAIAQIRSAKRLPDKPPPDWGWILAKGLLGTAFLLGIANHCAKLERPCRL
jgi:hypothetical protein